jgi:hypothetical protein
MAQEEMFVEHRKTWDGFVKLIVGSTVAVVLALVLMGIFLV